MSRSISHDKQGPVTKLQLQDYKKEQIKGLQLVV